MKRFSKLRRRAHRKGPIHAYVDVRFRASSRGKLKPYQSVGALEQAQTVWLKGANSVTSTALAAMREDVLSVADVLDEELDLLQAELMDQNPVDPDGPNDPPLHSYESWRTKLTERESHLTVSVTNPKDYMQFLEEGHSPQAPAGWIAMIFRDFWSRVNRRLRSVS